MGGGGWFGGMVQFGCGELCQTGGRSFGANFGNDAVVGSFVVFLRTQKSRFTRV